MMVGKLNTGIIIQTIGNNNNNIITVSMYKFFFHDLTWGNDVFVMYAIWAILIPLFLYVIRFIYKSVRPTKMKYQGSQYYLVRDVFLKLGGFEYLIVVTILYAIYLGFWAYLVNPFADGSNWASWQTYLIVLPQFATLIAIIVMFCIRYTKFRKPFVR